MNMVKYEGSTLTILKDLTISLPKVSLEQKDHSWDTHINPLASAPRASSKIILTLPSFSDFTEVGRLYSKFCVKEKHGKLWELSPRVSAR